MSKAKSLSQLKTDAANSDWGQWSKHWGNLEWHPSDEKALLEGCYFDLAAAERVRRFFRSLKIPNVKRSTPGDPQPRLVPFDLLKWWYRDVIGPIFGWKRADGRRRFDRGFVTTAKKSGKSTVLAALPLYMLTEDGEEEAECYSTAVDRDQAAIIFRKASRMKSLAGHLDKKLRTLKSSKRILFDHTDSFYEAISSDADSADGANPHLIIADELHRWRSREFFNTLMYGDIQRAQALFLMITTAGDDPSGICFEEYELAKDLIDPNTETTQINQLSVVCEASDDHEWDDPEGWKLANPSLLEGVGSIEKLSTRCEEARKTPKKQRHFYRMICNRWIEGVEDIYLDQDAWHACGQFGNVHEKPFEIPSERWAIPVVEEDDGRLASHRGLSCGGGLDLSSRIDITALCLAFQVNDFIDLEWWFWMPEKDLKDKEDRDGVPYRDWIAEGWIQATPGKTVNYAYIRKMISGRVLDENGLPQDELWPGRLTRRFNILEIAYDPWNSAKLVDELTEYDGICMTEMRQGFSTMNRPCKIFQADVLDHKIRHGNNPVAKWMASKAKNETDPKGNLSLSKKKSTHRIDAIPSAVMAEFVLLNPSPEVESTGAYNGESGSGMWD